MIRAPNQLSPKTKVVDLLFLYNFYFGQIPSGYMKFRVLSGQRSNQFIQTGHCSSTVLATVSPAGHTGDCSRRLLHALAVDDPRMPRCASLSGRGAISVFASPFSFLASRAEPSPCSAADEPRAGQPSPPQFDSARPNLPPLALPVLHPSLSSIDPFSAEIGTPRRGRH